MNSNHTIAFIDSITEHNGVHTAHFGRNGVALIGCVGDPMKLVGSVIVVHCVPHGYHWWHISNFKADIAKAKEYRRAEERYQHEQQLREYAD